MLVWALLLLLLLKFVSVMRSCVLIVVKKSLQNITPTGRASVNFSRSDDQMVCPTISVGRVLPFVSKRHFSSVLVALTSVIQCMLYFCFSPKIKHLFILLL